MLTDDDPFKFVKKKTYTVFYESVDSNLQKLIDSCDEDHTLVNLSVSTLLKQAVADKFNPTMLPFMVYCETIIYPNNDIQEMVEKTDEKNIAKWRNFIKEGVKNIGLTVFMKGKISDPKCKSSKKLVKLLDRGEFDDVRSFDLNEYEHLSHYLMIINEYDSIPQVYADGEFLGGVDELKKLIKAKEAARENQGC